MEVPARGQYRFVRKLATGGMGEVFLAEWVTDVGFRKPVVLKRLFPHLAEKPDVLCMFQDEAHLLAALDHPNIPQVYDLGLSDGRWHIAMEYVHGHTLADLCRAGAQAAQPMPLASILSLGRQACDALHHAHERHDARGAPLRIVHRDVTPGNIMVTVDGFVKLMDFGVARIAARGSTQGGALKGTLSYMAPEQVRGKTLDKRSDVFALGVILYELTTGQRLFQGTEVGIMTAIAERDVTPPSQLIPDFPKDVEQVLLTALSRDRARRWPSAAHLGRALEEVGERIGVSVAPRWLVDYMTMVHHALVPQPVGAAPVGAAPVGLQSRPGGVHADNMRTTPVPGRTRGPQAQPGEAHRPGAAAPAGVSQGRLRSMPGQADRSQVGAPATQEASDPLQAVLSAPVPEVAVAGPRDDIPNALALPGAPSRDKPPVILTARKRRR